MPYRGDGSLLHGKLPILNTILPSCARQAAYPAVLRPSPLPLLPPSRTARPGRIAGHILPAD